MWERCGGACADACVALARRWSAHAARRCDSQTRSFTANVALIPRSRQQAEAGKLGTGQRPYLIFTRPSIERASSPERLCSQRFDRRELSSQLSSLRHVFPTSASASVSSSSFSFFFRLCCKSVVVLPSRKLEELASSHRSRKGKGKRKREGNGEEKGEGWEREA